MNLTHPFFERSLISGGFGGDMLILENPEMMYRLVKEMQAQLSGEDGRFLLVKDGKVIAIEKCLHLLTSPFVLEHNPRKALTALYKQLDESLISAEVALRLDDLLSQMRDCLQQALPDSFAELDDLAIPEWDSTLKYFEVRFQTKYQSLVEELNAYFKMLKHYCGLGLFVCTHLLSYLSVTELAGLFTEAGYNEYNILDVEPNWLEGQQPLGKQLIILDKDDCEI